MLRWSILVGILLATLAAGGCGIFGRTEPVPMEDRDLHLVVKNHNFYDATLYAIGPGGSRQRLGRVSGNTDGEFTFRWALLELRIEIELLSVGSTVTEPLPVDEGDDLELIITTDLHRRIP